jgi:hypothetical protein
MKERKLQFNRDELSIIRAHLSEYYFEDELMKSEMGLSRAKQENATEKEINIWKGHISNLKSVMKTNKNLIKKVNKYFGFDNEQQ